MKNRCRNIGMAVGRVMLTIDGGTEFSSRRWEMISCPHVGSFLVVENGFDDYIYTLTHVCVCIVCLFDF